MLPLPSAAQRTLCCCFSAPQTGSALVLRLPTLHKSSEQRRLFLSSAPSRSKPHLFPNAPEVRPNAKPHLIIQILEDAFAVKRKPGVDQVYINYTLFSSQNSHSLNSLNSSPL